MVEGGGGGGGGGGWRRRWWRGVAVLNFNHRECSPGEPVAEGEHVFR